MPTVQDAAEPAASGMTTPEQAALTEAARQKVEKINELRADCGERCPCKFDPQEPINDASMMVPPDMAPKEPLTRPGYPLNCQEVNVGSSALDAAMQAKDLIGAINVRGGQEAGSAGVATICDGVAVQEHGRDRVRFSNLVRARGHSRRRATAAMARKCDDRRTARRSTGTVRDAQHLDIQDNSSTIARQRWRVWGGRVYSKGYARPVFLSGGDRDIKKVPPRGQPRRLDQEEHERW